MKTRLFNAEVVKEIRNNQVEVNVSENGKVEWILDSGCTDHIINNESYFTYHVCLKNPINVKVGDGRSVHEGWQYSNILFNLRKKNEY